MKCCQKRLTGILQWDEGIAAELYGSRVKADQNETERSLPEFAKPSKSPGFWLDRLSKKRHRAGSHEMCGSRPRETGMRGKFVAGYFVLALSPFLSGCSEMSKTAQGAGIGAGLGAVSGAVIGKANNGKAGQGALIGAAVGGVLGGLVGNDADRIDREKKDAQLLDAQARAGQAGSQMGIADVIQLAKEGRSDDLIINQMRTTASTYQLSTEDLRLLSSNGVSDRVIMEMQSRRPEKAVRYAPAPYRERIIYTPAPPPIYYLEPPPPPGFAVGVQIRR